MPAESERAFYVTVSRIPTSRMLYAIRKVPGAEPVLYTIMTAVINAAEGGLESLRVDSELRVEVDPGNPGHVIRAELLPVGQRGFMNGRRKTVAGSRGR